MTLAHVKAFPFKRSLGGTQTRERRSVTALPVQMVREPGPLWGRGRCAGQNSGKTVA